MTDLSSYRTRVAEYGKAA